MTPTVYREQRLFQYLAVIHLHSRGPHQGYPIVYLLCRLLRLLVER